jgi:hypothetical protein
MSRRPPSDLSERPGRSSVGSLAPFLAVACLVVAVACGNPPPSGSNVASPGVAERSAASTAEPPPDGTADTQPGDLAGLVVLAGGALAIGTPDGAVVGLDGPAGAVTGLSATKGRLIVQTAGPAFAIADIDRAGTSRPAWQAVELTALDGRQLISATALSPSGDKVAVATAAAGPAVTFDVFVIDLVSGVSKVTSIGRELNGPPVWIDDSSLLLEVLPIPGRTRFLRLDLVTDHIDPVAAEGFGPAISGDGALLVVASNDGLIVAVPAAGWLAGSPPGEGSLVDALRSPFGLAVDAAGRRIAIGYADEAGDPASIAVFVREGSAWRRRAVQVRIASGAPTMLGWLN